jgi:23S rRNA (uracil1939-C5)-methyltransferase
VKDLEEIPAKSPWNYRNRIQLRGEGTRLGFYASQSHEIVEASRCEIAREEINVKWNEVREAGALLKRPYKAEIEVLEDGTLRTVWNAKHGAAGFRQVNDAQNEAMREWVKRHVTPGRVVYDLFGGSGNLSKSLSQVANAIHCVDTSAPRQGSFGNYFFHRAAVLPWLMRFPKNPTTEASAIIDPPRQGLDRQFAAVHSELLKMQVTEVIAVGCDADSWARDLKHFTAKGWSIANAVAIDMFPQTPHVEAIARLTR